MINREIEKLMTYALQKGLVKDTDRLYSLNMLLDVLNLDEYEATEEEFEEINLEEILDNIVEFAIENNLIEDSIVHKDLFTTKLMGVLTPKPSEVYEIFENLYEEDPVRATDYFYSLSVDSDYIRKYRVCKDLKWTYPCSYGELDITVNLSKPEKDPKAIAAEKNAKQSGYPKCMLCKENEGYRGRLNHPARQNLRIIPVTINNESWFFQYSPYTYYNEHCIVFKGEHQPMKIDRLAFRKLLDFVKIFPHYFVGSNADLPIVGGSILSHDHFQGGNYTFAMEKAKVMKDLSFDGFDDVKAGIVDWPMSVIRLSGKDDERLVELADKILTTWRGYTDEACFVFAHTGDTPHNTITPIARKKSENFELDLVLRNNICTDEHPLGVYHPHAELHHIKKENIGLIEVMGLAVLPARLKTEMANLAEVLVRGSEIPEELSAHKEWAEEIIKENSNITEANVTDIINTAIGKVFMQVLEHAGVYKNTVEGMEGFVRFADDVNKK